MAGGSLLHLAGLPRLLDPALSTDPYYIDLARQPLAVIARQDPAWGPLYAVWLMPLRAVLGDPLAVYTANVVALSLATTLAFYAAALLTTRRAGLAAGAALLFTISDLNLPLANKVSSFALLLVLAGLAAAQLPRRRPARLAVAALATLLAAHARPELYPAAVLLALAAAAAAQRAAASDGARAWTWPAVSLVLLLCTAAALGTPLGGSGHDGDRLLIAFREHFGWNWSRWHGAGSSFAAIWQETFGAGASTLDALRANPLAVARHAGDNLLHSAAFLLTGSVRHAPVLAPASWPALVRLENLLSAALLFAALAVTLARPTLRHALRQRHGETLAIAGLLAAFPLAAAVLVYPLAHYLLVPATLLLFVAVLAVAQLLPPPRAPLTWGRGALAVLVGLAAVPKPFALPGGDGATLVGRVSVARRVTDTITFVRRLGLPAPVQVLTFTDGLGELLGDGFEEVKAWQKPAGQPLDDYLRTRGVDLIATLDGGKKSFFLDDPYWQVVQETPEAAGLVLLGVPGHPRVRLYLRRELLPPHIVPRPPEAALFELAAPPE